MSGISRKEEARLTAEYERDAEDDQVWEEVPPPARSDRGRRTLGTQVTIRLDGKSAEQLREIARARGLGYTSLLRAWIEERLNLEAASVRVSRPQITRDGFSSTSEPPLHLTGAGRMLRTGAA